MDIGSVQNDILAPEDNLIAPEMQAALVQQPQMENRQPVFPAPLGEASDIAPEPPSPHSPDTDAHVQRLVQQLAEMKIQSGDTSLMPASSVGESASSSVLQHSVTKANQEMPLIQLLKTIRKWTDVRFLGRIFLEKLGFHLPTWLKHHSKVVKTEQEIASMNVKGDYGI